MLARFAALALLVGCTFAQSLVVNGGFEQNNGRTGTQPVFQGWTADTTWQPSNRQFNPVAGGQWSASIPHRKVADRAGAGSASGLATSP